MPAVLRLALAAALAAALPGVAAAQAPAELGHQLYAEHCAECHGSRGGGQGDRGPSLVGVGELAADFYLRTGYMPLEKAGDQPTRNPNFFDDHEIDALIAYVASLGPGLPIPDPHPENGDPSEGLALFREHCAGCHQIVAQGGYVTGAIPPPLGRSTPVQIAEAVRIGPFVMPRFSEKRISDSELDSLIAYVQYAKSPNDAGGWSIGHVGPVPEGMVTWFLAATVLVGTCVLIGKRLRR